MPKNLSRDEATSRGASLDAKIQALLPMPGGDLEKTSASLREIMLPDSVHAHAMLQENINVL